MYMVVREGNLMIEVHDSDDRTSYTLKAWQAPHVDNMLTDEAEWGTTPLMDTLHLTLIQLITGIKPQVAARQSADTH